jgi:hypothetical protein
MDLSTISWNQLSEGFNSRIIQPLADKMARRLVDLGLPRLAHGQQRAPADMTAAAEAMRNIQPVVAYEMKAMTFNVATVCAIAYAAFALWGGMTVVTALVFVGGSYAIRTIAAHSMTPSETDKLAKRIDNAPGWFKQGTAMKDWNPNRLIISEICIFKTSIFNPMDQSSFVIKALFG